MLAKTTWGAGEYALMATALEPASALAVDSVAVSEVHRVIDVGTGTGNAALLAAARGASVLAVDLEPALLALAGDRANAAAAIDWVEGDAEALPAPDRRADVVISVFGAMYALDHARAARELVRVLAPSGRIALAAWTPGSFMPAMGAVIAPYLPPPPIATGPPSHWGDLQYVETLLRGSGAHVDQASLERLNLRFDDTGAAVDFLIRTAGHVISQRQRLIDEGRWEPLQRDLEALVSERNSHGAQGIDLQLEYLVVTARRD